MTARPDCTSTATYVAVDIAKKWNAVLVESRNDQRKSFKMANSVEEFDRLVAFLRGQPGPCHIAMEPTGNYHRALAHRLVSEGFEVSLVSSVAAARLRDAIFNSWDKNHQLDEERLARLARVDPKLLHPIQHRGGAAQADRALLRSRNALVECRTKLVNHARGMIKSVGGRLPTCSTPSRHSP